MLSFILVVLALCYYIFAAKIVEEKVIQKKINVANFCTVKEDCALIGSVCPFGCYIMVNKNKVTEIEGLLASYESRCAYSCVEMKEIQCISNRCAFGQ